jgi:hypothetical protein
MTQESKEKTAPQKPPEPEKPVILKIQKKHRLRPIVSDEGGRILRQREPLQEKKDIDPSSL